MTKLIVRHLLLALLLLSTAIACEIVDAGTEPGQPETMTPTGDPNDQLVKLGSGNVPEDPAAFASMLHNDSEKTWAASEFALEGLTMFQSCRLDDAVTLFANGTYQYDGGRLLCGAEDDTRMRSGTYAYDAAQALLIFEPGTAQEAVAQLITLEQGQLVFSAVYASDLFGSFDITGSYTTP